MSDNSNDVNTNVNIEVVAENLVELLTNSVNLTDVYYAGTQEQWNEIVIESGNDMLRTATIHFESTMPGQGEVEE